MQGLPSPAFDSLIEAMAEVIGYPADPLRTFPTDDDGAELVILLDVTWVG
jgi:hypothetical protein